MLERYKKISVESPRIFAAPAEERLLERLIWPLRQAKGTYMLGGYLSTISICGMVAEMAAILNFDLGSFQINDVEMTEKMQQNVFGSRFERLGQERRVNILFGYGIISSGLKEDFDTIRTKRRTYLHLWSSDHSTLADDAVACFLAAVRIVVSTLGLSIDGGKLILRQEVFQYLRDHGVEPSPSVDSGGE
ncbi:MAG: hypothetical protein U5O39_19995 [Gammaproteobacteria bacterium]|nr:hypothetical protein [Gammaproteobacteria bacterium]